MDSCAEVPSDAAAPPGPPVGAEEQVLRKISVRSGQCDQANGVVEPDAFNPTEQDVDGLSVDREWTTERPTFRKPPEAATGDPVHQHQGYYVARLPVRSIHELGLTVVPNARPGNPSHALIPELDYAARKSKGAAKDEFKRRRAAVARCVTDVFGPFPTIHPATDDGEPA